MTFWPNPAQFSDWKEWAGQLQPPLTALELQVQEANGRVAQRWDDLRAPASVVTTSLTSPPSYSSDGTLLFSATKTETIFHQFQMPHGWILGSTVYPHVHWAKTSSAAGNIYWEFGYKLVPVGGIKPGSWSTLASSTPTLTDNNTSGEHLTTDCGSITPSSLGLSGIIVSYLSRVGGNVADTYGGDVEFLEVDIHYQLDASGSTARYIK